MAKTAEEQFDAIFGGPSEKQPVKPISMAKFSKPKSDPMVKIASKKSNLLAPLKRNRKKDEKSESKEEKKKDKTVTPENKKPKLLSTRSPFALAFGSTMSDSDDDDIDDIKDDDHNKTAEQCWEDLISSQPEKPLKLRNLTKKKEEKADEFDEFGIDDPPSLSLKPERIKEPIKEEKETPPPPPQKSTKSGREKRFFKGRTEKTQYVIPSFTEDQESDDVNLFKKPQLPLTEDQPVPDQPVPETTRLTEKAAEEKEYADDVRFYLDGIQDASDVNLRALSAMGFAKKCQDEKFRGFLGTKKLSKKNRAHNVGQHVLLQLHDAGKPGKSSRAFALAASLAFYKCCTDKRIGISKYIIAIFKHLLSVEIGKTSETDEREFERMQTTASELMKPFSSRKWDHVNVITETVAALAIRHTKQVFNAFILIGGILEHLTNCLIDMMIVEKITDFDEERFMRYFDAFAEQTKPPYIKSQEMVMQKTNFTKVLRGFLDKVIVNDPAKALKENGVVDRATVHLARICTYSNKQTDESLTLICNKLAKDDFVTFCLSMLKQLSSQCEKKAEAKHMRKVGIAILLNLVAFSPVARAKVQQADNLNLICEVFIEEKKELCALHDGNITVDMNKTNIMNTLEESEKQAMSEEEQVTYGRLVSKADMHVGGVMTIGYAALIIANLVKANEFVMKRIKQQLDEDCFKLALDCFDEMVSIFSATGKEDKKSERLVGEAREIFKKHGYD